MIHVALLSRWHVHANDYAKEALENPDIQISAVWDEDPVRGRQWADELQVPFYEDLSTLLEDPSIQAVIVDTPTTMHKEVIASVILHKKHVFTEKVLATTTSDCDFLLKLAKDQQVQLMVSLPRLSDDYFVTTEKLFREGTIGELTSIRCRLAHDGALPSPENPKGWLPSYFFSKEQCGGGALIDLGAHPIYLTNRLAGPVKSLYASFTYKMEYEVEDHAVVVTNYESGCTGILETGFISKGSPFMLELNGTKGTVLVEDRKVRIRSKLLYPDQPGTFHEVQLQDSLPSAMKQWVLAIQNEALPTITHDDIRELTRINEAAIKSQIEGCKIQLV